MSTAEAPALTREQIAEIILEAIRDANQIRSPEEQIEETADAPLFGGSGVLDSLGLVSLLMDIEELLLDKGFEISLSSDDAMSRSSSPYRDVPSLGDYIAGLLDRSA